MTLGASPASNAVIRNRVDRWFEQFRRTGDARLLARVFDHTAPELGRVALHLCRDRHVAEDAVQGCFLAAIEAQHEWDASRPLLPWLLGILTNRVRELRRQRRTVDPARLQPAASEMAPDAVASQLEVSAAVQSALQRLPSAYRETLELHLLQDLPAHEIARALGVPAGTVRMRLLRGLEQLRQVLPVGVAGGFVVTQLSPMALAAMRCEVLAKVSGGAKVAAVSSASTGHFLMIWMGVMMMNKMMIGVVSVGVALAAFWWTCSFATEPVLMPGPPVPAVLAQFPPELQAEPGAGEAEAARSQPSDRVAASVVAAPAAIGRLAVRAMVKGSSQPLPQLTLYVLPGLDAKQANRRRAANEVGKFSSANTMHLQTDATGRGELALAAGHARIEAMGFSGQHWVAEIKSGASTELEIAIPSAIRAEVKVTDEEGAPVAGARILGRRFFDVGLVVENEMGRTDGAGSWRGDFVEERVDLRAVADGLVASQAAELTKEKPKQRLVLRRQPAMVRGVVRDSRGMPMAKAQVILQSRATGYAGKRPMVVIADDAGGFQVDTMPAGLASLFALPKIGTNQDRAARIDVELRCEDPQYVELLLDQSTRLAVQLIGADGVPVVGQGISAVPQPDPGIWPYLGIGIVQARSDASGTAELLGLMAGEHELQTSFANSFERRKVMVQAGQSEAIQWSLAPTSYIELRLMDAAEQALVGWEVAVHLLQGGIIQTAKTDTDGRVRIDGLAAGAAELRFTPARGSIVVHRCPAEYGRPIVVKLPATTGKAVVFGRADLAAGLAAADVTVDLCRREGEQMELVLSQPLAADGTFRCESLPGGSYLVLFRRGPESPLCMPIAIEVPPGGSVDAGQHQLAVGPKILVKVAAADGRPVEGVRIGVGLSAVPRRYVMPPVSGTDAGHELPQLPVGNYELLVWGADIVPTFGSLAVTNSHASASVVVSRAVPVQVDWQRRGGGLVRWFRDGEEWFACVFDGEATHFGLPAGRYSLEAVWGQQIGKAEFTVGSSPGEPVVVQWQAGKQAR